MVRGGRREEEVLKWLLKGISFQRVLLGEVSSSEGKITLSKGGRMYLHWGLLLSYCVVHFHVMLLEFDICFIIQDILLL